MTTRRTVVAIVGLAVSGVVIGGAVTAAGGAPARPAVAGVPVQTTWLSTPDDQRTATITIDTAALLDQMVDLPSPLPALGSPGTCYDIPAGAATLPLFDGASATIAGTSAKICEESSWWTVSWQGQNRRPDGGIDSDATAVALLDLDGSLRSGILMNATVGTATYRYTPDFGTPASDQYELTGYGFPDPLVASPVSTAPAPLAAPPASSPSGAAPAVPVAGSSEYAG